MTLCSEIAYENIIEAYEDLLDEDFEFDIEDFDDEDE